MHRVILNTYLYFPFQFDFSLEFDIPPARTKNKQTKKEGLLVWSGSSDCFEADWFHMETKKWEKRLVFNSFPKCDLDLA